MSEFAFPFRVDRTGRTAGADRDEHVRQLIEQVLLTSPGERVNRPQFGSGLLDLVFAPATPEIMAAARMRTQGVLQQELDQAVQIRAVDIVTNDNVLTVAVDYTVRASGIDASTQFTVNIPR